MAEWSEVDIDRRLWTIPAARMKVASNGDLRIPLPTQALQAFETLHAITGQHRYVLTTGIPRRGDIHSISDGTLNKALAQCVPREEHVVHSFRQTAYTLLRKKGNYEKPLIKVQMHHAREKVEAAYNKDDEFQQRKDMLQWWANYLDTCRGLAHGE